MERNGIHPFVKKYGKLLLKISIAMTILYFLIHTAQLKFSLFTGILHQPFLLTCTTLMFIVMIFLGARRWHLLNSAQNIHLKFKDTLTLTYLGFAFNNILPGSVGGDFVRSYYLFKKSPNQKSTAVISIFLDRLFGLLGLIISVCIVALLRLNQFNEYPQLFYLLLLFVFLCLSIVIVFGIFMIFPQRLGIITWIEKRFNHLRLARYLVSLLNAMQNYKIPFMVMVECLFLSVLVQTAATFAIIMIAKMMGFPVITFSDYMIAIGFTQIVNLIPATPGGIGIGEMAFANILLLLNPDKSDAFATIFLGYRFIGILTFLPGVIYSIPHFLFLKKTPSKELTY